MNEKTFIQTCQDYVGQFSRVDNCIIFSNKNTLIHRFNDYNERTNKIEFVEKKKKVLCTLKYDIETDLLQAQEETVEIVGGFSCSNCTDASLKILLARYNFERKIYKQMSLFDDIESEY